MKYFIVSKKLCLKCSLNEIYENYILTERQLNFMHMFKLKHIFKKNHFKTHFGRIKFKKSITESKRKF